MKNEATKTITHTHTNVTLITDQVSPISTGFTDATLKEIEDWVKTCDGTNFNKDAIAAVFLKHDVETITVREDMGTHDQKRTINSYQMKWKSGVGFINFSRLDGKNSHDWEISAYQHEAFGSICNDYDPVTKSVIPSGCRFPETSLTGPTQSKSSQSSVRS